MNLHAFSCIWVDLRGSQGFGNDFNDLWVQGWAWCGGLWRAVLHHGALWPSKTESCGSYTIPSSVLGWVAGWLAGWLAGWRAEWLDWLAGWVAGWPDGWMNGWTDDWLAGMSNRVGGWDLVECGHRHHRCELVRVMPRRVGASPGADNESPYFLHVAGGRDWMRS